MNFTSTQKIDSQQSQAYQIKEILSQEDEDYSQSNNFTLFSMPYISNDTIETSNEGSFNHTSNQNLIFNGHGYNTNDSLCYSNCNNRYSYVQPQPQPHSRSPSQSHHHHQQGKTYNSPYVFSNNNNSYNKNQILLNSLQSQSTEDSFLIKTNQNPQNPYSNHVNPMGNPNFNSQVKSLSSSFLQSYGEAIKEKTIETIKTRLYSNEMSFIFNSHLQKTIQKTNELKDLLIEAYEKSEISHKDHIKSLASSLSSHFSSMSSEISGLFDRHVKYNEYYKGIEEKISFYLQPLIEKEEKVNEIQLKIRKDEGNLKENAYNDMLSIINSLEEVINEIEFMRSSVKNKENSSFSLSVRECGRINKVFNSRLESIINEFYLLKNGGTFQNLTVSNDIAMYEVVSTMVDKKNEKNLKNKSKIDGFFCFERFNKKCFVVDSKKIRKKKCFLDDSTSDDDLL